KTKQGAGTGARRNDLPWPVNGKIILNYGKNKHPDYPDLGTKDALIISNGIKIKAADNSHVKSVEEGTVMFAQEFRRYGKMIIVNHKDVFYSFYCQLNKILVKENQKISKQQDIAKLGKGENAVLYFEIRQSGEPENPLLWLKDKK
ncbi:MAG: peptidoglycan DD-metalloendopeptidase family protein, partial [Elusimicrobia bacterium]|nr:peptidoglycan DD-metalloendopeptidase family protein [Elusimicrobiota bacterium]